MLAVFWDTVACVSQGRSFVTLIVDDARVQEANRGLLPLVQLLQTGTETLKRMAAPAMAVLTTATKVKTQHPESCPHA